MRPLTGPVYVKYVKKEEKKQLEHSVETPIGQRLVGIFLIARE